MPGLLPGIPCLPRRGSDALGWRGDTAWKGGHMSNHFTGLSLGPPLGDQRLDLCDLYAFQRPPNPARTVLILNANPEAADSTRMPSTG